MDRQLSKLMEQALWAMAIDPAFATPCQSTIDTLEEQEVPLENWMVDAESPNSKRKKQKKKNKKSELAGDTLDAAKAAEDGECCPEPQLENEADATELVQQGPADGSRDLPSVPRDPLR